MLETLIAFSLTTHVGKATVIWNNYISIVEVVQEVRRLDVSFSLRSPTFSPRVSLVGFVVDDVARRQIFL
jgi:hypothetical protein